MSLSLTTKNRSVVWQSVCTDCLYFSGRIFDSFSLAFSEASCARRMQVRNRSVGLCCKLVQFTETYSHLDLGILPSTEAFLQILNRCVVRIGRPVIYTQISAVHRLLQKLEKKLS